ncbi:MAG: PspC domain-containing protein, partial [Oligoflexales bacterium]|nr:PspC domain-containing protein [Oligoflexales bacterium]
LDRQKKILGVCYRLSQRAQLPVGLVRFLTACLAIFSFGAVLVAYLVLFFLVPLNHDSENILHNKNRSTP